MLHTAAIYLQLITRQMAPLGNIFKQWRSQKFVMVSTGSEPDRQSGCVNPEFFIHAFWCILLVSYHLLFRNVREGSAMLPLNFLLESHLHLGEFCMHIHFCKSYSREGNERRLLGPRTTQCQLTNRTVHKGVKN